MFVCPKSFTFFNRAFIEIGCLIILAMLCNRKADSVLFLPQWEHIQQNNVAEKTNRIV